MAWVQQTPFNDAASGTTPADAQPFAGGVFTVGTVGGGAAWVSSASGRGFDINDNFAMRYLGGSAIDTWFHGSKTVALGCVINDARSAQKTWMMATGTSAYLSVTYHGF